MLRIITPIFALSAFICTLTLLAPWHSIAQSERPLNIAEIRYEYYSGSLYDSFDLAKKGFAYPRGRIVYAKNDSIGRQIKETLDQCIRKMWTCTPETPEIIFSSPYNDYNFEAERTSFPTYKTKPPKDRKGENFLFLRVMDCATPEWDSEIKEGKQWHKTGTFLLFTCKIIHGGTKEILFYRKMKVSIIRTPVPQEEYPLFKLPGMPDSFMVAFNRASELFLGPSTPPESVTFVVPAACIYLDLKKEKQVKIPLDISISQGWVDIKGGTALSWQVGQISSEKVKKKPQWLGNVLGALLSANSTSYADYWFINKNSFYFPDETSTALLTIPSMEKRENNVVTERHVAGECFYTQGNDTIARFGFWNVPKALPLDTARYFWNGYDSATIQPMPNSWTNRGLYNPTVVKGVIYGKNFLIQNTNAPNMFDISYNGKLIATIKTDDEVPVNGYLYNAGLPQNTYRTLIVLATIPFAWYGQ